MKIIFWLVGLRNILLLYFLSVNKKHKCDIYNIDFRFYLPKKSSLISSHRLRPFPARPLTRSEALLWPLVSSSSWSVWWASGTSAGFFFFIREVVSIGPGEILRSVMPFSTTGAASDGTNGSCRKAGHHCVIIAFEEMLSGMKTNFYRKESYLLSDLRKSICFLPLQIWSKLTTDILYSFDRLSIYWIIFDFRQSNYSSERNFNNFYRFLHGL